MEDFYKDRHQLRLHISQLAPCKGIRIPESNIFFILESGIQRLESRIQFPYITVSFKTTTDSRPSRPLGTPFPTTTTATSRFAHLEKFSLNCSSSSFAIRVDLRHPAPSLFLLGLLSPLWCFSILRNYYFVVSFNLKVIFHGVKSDSKCRVIGPLNKLAVSLWSSIYFRAGKGCLKTFVTCLRTVNTIRTVGVVWSHVGLFCDFLVSARLLVG